MTLFITASLQKNQREKASRMGAPVFCNLTWDVSPHSICYALFSRSKSWGPHSRGGGHTRLGPTGDHLMRLPTTLCCWENSCFPFEKVQCGGGVGYLPLETKTDSNLPISLYFLSNVISKQCVITSTILVTAVPGHWASVAVCQVGGYAGFCLQLSPHPVGATRQRWGRMWPLLSPSTELLRMSNKTFLPSILGNNVIVFSTTINWNVHINI